MAEIKYIPVSKLWRHPDNPRKDLGDVTELAESIKVNGVLQNLTVVPLIGEITKKWDGESYRVIIGHRRLAAAKIAGLTELPCIVAEMTEKEQLSTMLVENMQRSDLTFYRKRPKAAAAKKSAAQIAEEKAVARALASVKEETEIAYELRKTFIDSLHVTQKNIGLMLRGAAIGTVAGAALYKSADRNAILRLVDIDPDGKWDDVRSGAVNAAVSLDNDDLIPSIIYAQFQDSKNNGYYTAYKTEWLRHDKNLMLDALYAWLISMGYEMSDDEKALQNGTHELFKEATE